MQNILFHSNPKSYGLTYLLLIPIFAFIFFFTPNVIGENRSFIECIYFSTVTITTLGYGDITPTNDIGRLISASESVLGIIIIGLFLNSLSRKRSEDTRTEELQKEKQIYEKAQISKLHGHFNLINQLSVKHTLSVIQITSPLKDRSEIYNPNFTINDMKDLYFGSLLMTQSHNEPAIKHYFISLDNLNNEIIELIKMVDLKLFPELETICLSFISAYYEFDFSDSILGVVNTRMGDKPMKDFVKDLLENHKGEPKYMNSNMINGYVALLYQIKIHMELIEKMQNESAKYKS